MPLSWAQRVVLQALRGFDDATLVAAAPRVYELVAGLDPTAGDPASGRSPTTAGGAAHGATSGPAAGDAAVPGAAGSA